MGRIISADEAAELIPDGARVMLCGPPPGIAPIRLVDALVARRVRGLTVIARDLASPGAGVSRLIEAGCVARAIVARAGSNAVARRRLMREEFALEILGPESFVERIRAAGRGLGGVLVPSGRRVGADTGLMIELDGLPHVVERPLRAQFALLAASRADLYFDLAYARDTPEVAPLMASAVDCVVVEPETMEQEALPSSVLQTSGVAVTYILRPAR